MVSLSFISPSECFPLSFRSDIVCILSLFRWGNRYSDGAQSWNEGGLGQGRQEERELLGRGRLPLSSRLSLVWPPQTNREVTERVREEKGGGSPKEYEGLPSKRPSSFTWGGELALPRPSSCLALFYFFFHRSFLSEIRLFICFNVHLSARPPTPSFFTAHLAHLRIYCLHNGPNEKLPCEE